MMTTPEERFQHLCELAVRHERHLYDLANDPSVGLMEAAKAVRRQVMSLGYTADDPDIFPLRPHERRKISTAVVAEYRKSIGYKPTKVGQ